MNGQEAVAVAENVARVRERIARAAESAGRDPAEIILVVVTKRQSLVAIQAAVAAGVTEIGENYVQEALSKQELAVLSQPGQPSWHLIGHLQSNKAKQAVAAFDLIQSTDSIHLARAIARQALSLGKTQHILLQVHLGDEETKSGLPSDRLLDVAAEAATIHGLEVGGLMGIAPGEGDPRPHFAALRRLFEQLPSVHRRILSMGMTGDFETAIAEGATMVRVGTAVFGPRQG